MDRVLDLTEVLSHEMVAYIVSSFNARLLYTENPTTHTYTVTSVPGDWHKRPHVMLLAQVVNQSIVILADTTDRPLYENLMNVGVLREQIVLAYQGEAATNKTKEGAL
jgi:hypothetical protein